MNILGIETSCDETGVAIYCTERGLVAEALHSQVDLHAVYGGVVPEIASRDHIRRLLPLVAQVLADAGIKRPDAVAYTAGPGPGHRFFNPHKYTRHRAGAQPHIITPKSAISNALNLIRDSRLFPLRIA